MKKDPYGVFEVVVPAKDGKPAIAHNSKMKVCRTGSAVASLANLADLPNYTFWQAN